MRNHPAIEPSSHTNMSGVRWGGSPYDDFMTHSSAQRVLTSAVEVKALRAKYPDRVLTFVGSYNMFNGTTCDLLGFAASGQAKATLSPETSDNMIERSFLPPARRLDEDGGSFVHSVKFAAYDYEYQGSKFLLYVVYCSQGYMSEYQMNFILSPPGSKKANGEGDDAADVLIEAATRWGQALHEEVLVFDRGIWMKDKDLYKSVDEASWDDVILDKDKKQAIIDDAEGFFSSEANYKEFQVPWKRGLIFYGPPGNGKTISIKALMNSLTKRKDPTVELLYVKTFSSFMGPEFGINMIFQKARQVAPCILIFEDIDSLVSPGLRSYFLNAVDGLESNHGILMIGSTNHLERLDPGIAKRPSRFDRKYMFDLPNHDERIQYSQYWRCKLKDNKKIDFPEALCSMIADITEDFSFAYMKEAFVASLLVLARAITPSPEKRLYIGPNVVFGDRIIIGDDDDDGRKKAEKTPLWKEIQKQVKILRDEMDNSAVQERIKKDVVAEIDAGVYQMTMGPSQRETRLQ